MGNYPSRWETLSSSRQQPLIARLMIPVLMPSPENFHGKNKNTGIFVTLLNAQQNA